MDGDELTASGDDNQWAPGGNDDHPGGDLFAPGGNDDHLGGDLWAPGGDGYHLEAYDGERDQLTHGSDGSSHLQAGSDGDQLADGGNSNQPDRDEYCLGAGGDSNQPDCDGNCLDAGGDGNQLAPSGDSSQRGTRGYGVQIDQLTFCLPAVARFRHADVVVWPSYFNLECVHHDV